MKLFALSALLLINTVSSIKLHSLALIEAESDRCDPTCDADCGPSWTNGLSLEELQSKLTELQAEIKRREGLPAGGCADGATTTTTAAGTTTTSTTTTSSHPPCSVIDGSGQSDSYPCICLSSPGPAPAPPPGPAPGPAPPEPVVCRVGDWCKFGDCLAPPDNFADEIADQANVDFDSLDKDKNGCLSDAEMTVTLREQVKVARERNYYWQEKKVMKHEEHLADKASEKYDLADENNNGCLSKKEYEEARKAHSDCKRQFMMMDYNGDGKISRQEAATYSHEHLKDGDLHFREFRGIFEAADMDKNHYLTEPEFCTAGPKYHGDGKDKF